MPGQIRQVQVIRPTVGLDTDACVRIAAYCRVSTDSEDQANSFLAQVKYYREYADTHANVELVDIYADEGITGTCMDKREDLLRLLKDCSLGSRPSLSGAAKEKRVTKKATLFSLFVLNMPLG